MSTKHVRFVANLLDSPSFSIPTYAMATSLISHGHQQLRKTPFPTFVRAVAQNPKPAANMPDKEDINVNKLEKSAGSINMPGSARTATPEPKENNPGWLKSYADDAHMHKPDVNKELPPVPDDENHDHESQAHSTDIYRPPTEFDEPESHSNSSPEAFPRRWTTCQQGDAKLEQRSTTGSILVVLDRRATPESIKQPDLDVNDPRTCETVTPDQPQDFDQSIATAGLYELPTGNVSGDSTEARLSALIYEYSQLSPAVSLEQLEEKVLQAGSGSREVPITPERARAGEVRAQIRSQKKAIAVMGIDKETLQDDSKRKKQRFRLKWRHPARDQRPARPHSTASILDHQLSLTSILAEDDISDDDSQKSASRLASEDWHGHLRREEKSAGKALHHRHSTDAIVPEPLRVPLRSPAPSNDSTTSRDKAPLCCEVSSGAAEAAISNSIDPWPIRFDAEQPEHPSHPRLDTALPAPCLRATASPRPQPRHSTSPRRTGVPVINALQRAKAKTKAEIGGSVKGPRHWPDRHALPLPLGLPHGTLPTWTFLRSDCLPRPQPSEKWRDVLKANITVAREAHGMRS